MFLFSGLFLGTAIHETSQVAAAGLIYDQQFDSPETLNIATVTKLIRNTFLVIMIPLFAFGPTAENFMGTYNNTELYHKILQAFHISKTK